MESASHQVAERCRDGLAAEDAQTVSPGSHKSRSWPQTVIGVLSGLLLATAWAPSAGAYSMSDRAALAFVRPCPKIADYEAEACPNLPADSVVADPLTANGKAVKLTPGGGTLSFGRELERGTYSVWCIGRSDKPPTEYREPMYAELVVPELPRAEGAARVRINYMSDMYQDVAHLYIEVRQPTRCTFQLRLAPGSQFNLLVDRLELRDVLGNTWKKGFKTASSLYGPPPAAAKQADLMYPREEALDRARSIAASFPPRNAILAGGGMTTAGYYREYTLDLAGRIAEPNSGRWLWQMEPDLEKPWRFTGPLLPAFDDMDDAMDAAPAGHEARPDGATTPLLCFGDPPKNRPDLNWGNSKLGEAGDYTLKEFLAFQKSGGRWPDDGNGYFVPQARAGETHNLYFNWMAVAFKNRYLALRQQLVELAEQYQRSGDPRAAFRSAVLLAAYADRFPCLDYTVHSTMQITWGTYPFNTFAGRVAGEFGKLDYSGWEGPNNLPVVIAYDKIFPFIADNQLLADAVGQFVPGVKTPQDVIALIDVKFLQHFFDVCDRNEIRFDSQITCDPLVAIVQGNNEAGRAMLRRVARETNFDHIGVMDGNVCRHSRDATTFIGSFFYAKGPALSAGATTGNISRFARQCAWPELDLSTPGNSGQLFQAAQWLIEPYVAGVHLPGVGDVSGPYGYPSMDPGEDPESQQRLLLNGWEQYRDPRFAWMLKHVYSVPRGLPAETVAALDASAAGITLDPRKTAPARVLHGFGVSLLEAHREQMDFRKRAGLVMRTGTGSGHSHSDQLNLEWFARGVVMGPEFGGRGGYGEPPTSDPRCHNLVTINGSVPGMGRTTMIADVPGLACTEGVATGLCRFACLIEVGDADAYVFEVTRASGGEQRAYWFHGPETEAVDTDAITAKAQAHDALTATADAMLDDDDAKQTYTYNQQLFSHNATPEKKVPEAVYQAVWPLSRRVEQETVDRVLSMHRFADGQKPVNPFKATDPRLFARLLLFESQERQVETFVATSKQVRYRITCTGVSEKKTAAAVSQFAAVQECFAGKPFITGWQALALTPAAPGAVFAAELQFVDGRRDVLVQAADPAVGYTAGGKTPLSVRGSFGMVSFQGPEPRAAALARGTEVTCGPLGLKLERSAYEATIRQVDFIRQTVTLDRQLPVTALAPCHFLLGRSGEPFRVTRIEAGPDGSVLHIQKTAEVYRSPLFRIVGGRTVLGLVEGEHPFSNGWLTTEDRSQGWRVAVASKSDIRWLGTGFRGGATMGGPISWDRVPDANGDGKRTLILGPGDWKGTMTAEVLDVMEDLRAFVFRPLAAPEGYAGSRSYAGAPIVNERGERLSTCGIPGKLDAFTVESDRDLTAADFADLDKDGQARFHVYHFGPGDPAVIPVYAGVRRAADGTWQLRANAPVIVTVPGAGRVACRDEVGAWKDLESKAENGAVTATLSGATLGTGELILRVAAPEK